MFGVPIVVNLYCFFIAVSPFCPKDSGQTRRILATLKIFFLFFSRTRKELATLACSLVDKEETRRFFFLAESLSDFGLKTFMCANTNRAVARGKKYSENYQKARHLPIFFTFSLATFAQIGLFGFRRKTKKLKGVNNQNEKSSNLCPLFQ